MTSDTIAAMRMTLAVASVVTACASDPTLHVTVTHPQGLAIGRTTITVYESESLTCEDVEFSRLSATELDAAAVTSETIDASGTSTGALTGISRTDHKVIVGRGFDAMGKLLAAGCVEHDVVDGNLELAITTQVAVTVSIVPPDPTSTDPSAAQVGALDPMGKIVDGRPVSWTLYGPAGSPPLAMTNVTMAGDGTWQPKAPSCTAGGLLKIHPVPPGVVGGFAVQMRVAWSVELPALYTGLTSTTLGGTGFTPPAGATRFCAIRSNGATHRLVCLDGSGVGVIARDYEVQVAGGAATLVEKQNQTVLPESIAIIAVPNGSDRDVYAVTTRGRLQELFGASAADNTSPVCAPATTCATPVDDAVALPPCGAAPGKIVMHTSATGAGQLVEMNARGGGTVTYPLPPAMGLDNIAQLDRAGCVTAVTASTGSSSLRQALVVQMGRPVLNQFVPAATFLSYGCSGASLSCTALPVFPGAGAAFTTGTEPRLVSASLDATGVVVLQVVLATDASGRDHFIERARVAAAALPEHIVIGQFDTDSTADMLWSVSGKRDTTTAFEVAYARLAIDQPLEALSPFQTTTIDDILAGDLTGDGRDDVVITGQLSSGATGIAVVAMDVATAAAVPPADPTCAP